MCPLFVFLLATAFLYPLHARTTCGWNPESDGDYFVMVTDLLVLLSVPEEADSDMDGIFDSHDNCVGSYNACGLCNDPGPSVPEIDEIAFMTDSVFLPPLQQWYAFSYAVDTLYTSVCLVQGCTDANAANFNPQAVIEDGSCTYGPAECGDATTVNFDGHTYALVAIGTQCWFAENLRSDNYRNGDAIPGNLNDSQWTSTSSGAQAVYGEGSSNVYQGSSDEAPNLATYGRLYNGYAVNDSRGLCPSGFHVPSDEEWLTLEMALGMTSSQANSTGWRGTDQGTQLKTPSWGGTNSCDFSALPGGYRSDTHGYFSNQGFGGYWWSSSPIGANAWNRFLFSDYPHVYRYNYCTRYGFSVRCVRDL